MGVNAARSILSEATRLKEAGEKREAYFKYLKFIFEVVMQVLGPNVLQGDEAWPQLSSNQVQDLFRFTQQALDHCEECLPTVINLLKEEADRLDELEMEGQTEPLFSQAPAASSVSIVPAPYSASLVQPAAGSSPLLQALAAHGDDSLGDLPLLEESDRPLPEIPLSCLFIQHSQMTWRIQLLMEQVSRMEVQGGKVKANALYLNTLRGQLRLLEEWQEKRRLVIANIVRTWDWTLLEQNPADLAKELMHISWRLFTAVPMEELKAQEGPAIAHTQSFFCYLSNWVRLEILRPTSSDTRVRHLMHWIAVARELNRMNAFDPLVAILTGLNNAAIKRTCMISLRRLPRKPQFELEELTACVSEANGYSNLRHLHLKSDGACVPFLGIYLADCRNASKLGARAAKEAEQMLEVIQQAKARDPLILPRNDLLNHWILSRPFLTSEELYELAEKHRERGDLKLATTEEEEEANVPEARAGQTDQGESVMFEVVAQTLRDLQQK